MPRVLDARPDTVDFRDRMYQPTLVDVPPSRPLADYKQLGAPILDQGQEGACTGFGLAAVCNYLLRTRAGWTDETPVSPHMLYTMARRYDEWPGETYEGSSARGAMKGWHKHGVCASDFWRKGRGRDDRRLTDTRAQDARARPLGAYYRVNHKDLVAMHAAIAEVGVLYATALVHSGWDQVRNDGVIHYRNDHLGGHAFAIVAYDERGFWLQNSWGRGWGHDGFARVSYEDWLENGTDVWVARLGVPIQIDAAARSAKGRAFIARQATRPSDTELRPHIVSVGNDGQLRNSGSFASDDSSLAELFETDLPRLTADWEKKRIVLYAHGGLVAEADAVDRVADYRGSMLGAQVYPLAFVWKSDFWTTLSNILEDSLRRRRPEGALDAAKDFLLDRLDDSLEPIARALTGRAQWKEMKENALAATTSSTGAARKLAAHLHDLMQSDPAVELHLVGHSAGSIFHAPLVQLLTSSGKIANGPLKGEKGLGLTIASCTLWAPACTVKLFKETYLPSIESGKIERFTLFTLTDQAEQDDHCAKIYHKSLLYLVSHAFEDEPRIPLFRQGEAILGMQRYIDSDPALKELFKASHCSWVLAPNQEPHGSVHASTADGHGDFDDDPATVLATLARILGKRAAKMELAFPHSAGSLRSRRVGLQK